MKVIVNEKQTPQREYPKLMYSIDEPDDIFFFFREGYGYPVTGTKWNVKHFTENQGKLNKNDYEDFTGSITISNDD